MSVSRARLLADTRSTSSNISIEDVTNTSLVPRATPGTGTDITPYIDSACSLLRTRSPTGRGIVHIPSGNWRMGAPANDDSLAGNIIMGVSPSATNITYDYPAGSPFNFDGENVTAGWGGGGVHNMRIALGAVDGVSTGLPSGITLSGVNLGAGGISEPDDFSASNIYLGGETLGVVGTTTIGSNIITSITPTNVWIGQRITHPNIPGGATVTAVGANTVTFTPGTPATVSAAGVTIYFTSRFYNGFFAYGNLRTSPQGIRVCEVRNLQIFDCSNTGFYGSNLVQWVIENVGTYGYGTGLDAYITGGGTGPTNSNMLSAKMMNIGGTFFINNTTNLFVEGKCNNINISAADYVAGTIWRSGTRAIAPGANWNLFCP